MPEDPGYHADMTVLASAFFNLRPMVRRVIPAMPSRLPDPSVACYMPIVRRTAQLGFFACQSFFCIAILLLQ